MKKKESVSASINMADRADNSSSLPRQRPWTEAWLEPKLDGLKPQSSSRILMKYTPNPMAVMNTHLCKALGAVLAIEPCHHYILTSTQYSWQTMTSATAILTKAPTFLTWWKRTAIKLTFWNSHKEILTHLRLLAEKLGKQAINNDDEEEPSVIDESGPNKEVSSKVITHKEMAELLAKARADGAFRKKADVLKYLREMDFVPFPPKLRLLKLQSYTRGTSAYRHVVHFNTSAGSQASIANCDALKIWLFVSTF